MRELLRTNDTVRLSWLQAMLASAGIEAVILDTHTSVIEGSVGAIPRRLMVHERTRSAPRRAERDRRGGMSAARAHPTSDDTLLGGRVKLRQPLDGYRVAIDPVLLAASVPASAQDRVLDIGCGSGAASLCLAARVPDCPFSGWSAIRMARLAGENIAAMISPSACRSSQGDLLAPPATLAPGSFTQVMANPPFLEAARPRPRRSRARLRPRSKARRSRRLDRFRARDAARQRHADLDPSRRSARRSARRAHGRAGGVIVFPLWPGEGKPASASCYRRRKAAPRR